MHEWPQARDIYKECGPHQLQAVLRVHGKEVTIEELYYSPLHRRRDYTLPWYVPGILRRYGIASRMRFWFRARFARNLARSVKAGHPVLFVINSIQGKGSWHWISAWDYDPSTGEFFCYDSQCPTVESSHGNIHYSAAILERALPWYGTFVIEITP